MNRIEELLRKRFCGLEEYKKSSIMRKLNICIFILMIGSSLVYSQSIHSIMARNKDNYFDQMKEIHADSIKEASISQKEKKRLNRWEWFWETRVDGEGGFDRYREEILRYMKEYNASIGKSSKKTVSSMVWEKLGPYSRPTGTSSSIGQGRFNCLWVDPTNSAHIIAGSNNGGLWETENANNVDVSTISWTNITDPYYVGGVSDIAVHPTNSDIIYFTSKVGTGGIYRDLVGRYSLGVFKTVDGGNTWSLIHTCTVTNEIKRIKIHPTNSNTLYLLSSNGMEISYNGGVSWSGTSLYLQLSSNQYLEEFEFRPGNSNIIYVSGRNSLFKSTDGGGSWSTLLGTAGLETIYNDVLISIGVDENAPSYLHAYYCIYDGGLDDDSSAVYVYSSNEGFQWSVNTMHSAAFRARVYVIGLWVAPDGDIYLGGMHLYRNPNLGFSLSSGIHSDVRGCSFLNSSPDYIYQTNDGGIFRSVNDGASWVDITSNLSATEFYDIGTTEANSEVIIGGAQDCGSYIRNSNGSWSYITGGGDGNTCLLDQSDEAKYYYTITDDFFRKNPSKMLQVFPKIGYAVGMDPKNSNVLYKVDNTSGSMQLMKSTNRGDNWTNMHSLYRRMSDIDFCYDDPNNFYIVTYDRWWKGNSVPPTKLFFSSNGGGNLAEVSIQGFGSILDDTPILSVKCHPYDPNKVWISLGGFDGAYKIYYSADAGVNWERISSSGLPQLPISCLEYDFLNGVLYAGTDVGLFYKSNDENEWSEAGDLPKVMISKLEINKASGDLVVGTFGRGVYRTNLGAGYCKPAGSPSIIYNAQNWSTDSERCNNIEVVSGGVLTVSSKTIMSFESTIVVNSGGELIVDDGEIINANIIVENGGELSIVNGGKIVLSGGGNLEVETGGLLDIDNGEILKSFY